MGPREVAALFSADGEAGALEYLRGEGLLEVLEGREGDAKRIRPSYPDLARLHAVVRQRRVLTILEFGLGYSTVVMADALLKNRSDWDRLSSPPVLRNSTPFELHAVDTSKTWIERTKEMLPSRLGDFVTMHHSGATAGTFQGRVCHYYDRLPAVLPDLIYLDGPDPAAVDGDVANVSWDCPDYVVMSADVARIEPLLLPGALVIVDGRTATSRFLAAHLYRNWKFEPAGPADVTVFELQEAPLGEANRATLQYCLGERALAWPEPVG